MDYNIEEIVKAIKAARKNRRLSQRALSQKAGIPQGHISNIERGNVDIKLSTLIELARALDLEVTLVPRKMIPAVQSITRTASPGGPDLDVSRDARNELAQIKKALKQMQAAPEAFKEIQQIQEAARELSNYYKLPANFTKQFREISETLRAFREGVTAVNELRAVAKSMQSLRNQIVHALPQPSSKPRPAYSLDEDDHA